MTCSDISSLVLKQSDLRQKSTSEKHPSSPVEVAFNDSEHIDDSEYSGTQKSRKLSEMDNLLSASQETPSSNHCPKSSFVPQSGQSTPPNGTVTNVADTVINEEVPSDMLMENHVDELHPHQRESEASANSEGTQTQTQQQPNRAFEDTLNVNEASNQEIPPMITPGFELVYNGKGMNCENFTYGENNANLLGKELTTNINSMCQASKNAVMLTDNDATEEVKSNHLMEAPIQSLDYLDRQDEDIVNDKQLLLSSPNAGNSEFTTDNTALKISAATGSSIPSQLAVSQISDLQIPFVKRLPAIWSIFEDLDMFKKVPQRPHFFPLQEYLPGLREDRALGFMLSIATSAESTSKLSIEDRMEMFENNINELRHLEKYVFTVQHLLHYLNKLLQIKSDYTKNLEEKKKLNMQIFKKTYSLAQMDSSHREKDKAIAEHEMKLGQLCGEVQQIAKEEEHEEAELSRLEHDYSSVEESCDNEQLQFRSILDQLQQKHLTAQVPKLT
uniref:Uncharacterized protein n=1 Tax=Setaria viridis TaxID=4556 RepID=A0A4V6D343_SETVI|nr:hypothetical protein SEVIR_8G161500v2 [Setaria viridis]